MHSVRPLWRNPADHVRRVSAAGPVLYFSPRVLAATARRFIEGFPGLVTYAVKANDAPEVLDNLVAARMTVFDVASPEEMERARARAPGAVLHFNNPVRSVAEIECARGLGVRSFSVDSASELVKLASLLPAEGTEVSVRLKLPVVGAAYEFGAKFGAGPGEAEALLRQVAALGFAPSMTFHPGTQCTDAAAWESYVRASAEVARAAGVRLARLNVGGGFPSHRRGAAPDLEAIFAVIDAAVERAFGPARPQLLCEPGRAMVADAFTLGAHVRALPDDRAVFLDDGIYGGLAEALVLGVTDRITVLDRAGRPRRGPPRARTVFGPTCDSLDRLPDEIALPSDLAEGDTVLFEGQGAYSTATATRFNGFGHLRLETVLSPAPRAL